MFVLAIARPVLFRALNPCRSLCGVRSKHGSGNFISHIVQLRARDSSGKKNSIFEAAIQVTFEGASRLTEYIVSTLLRAKPILNISVERLTNVSAGFKHCIMVRV